MKNSTPTHDGPERRQESNADLRARLDEIARKVLVHPKLTEDDLRQLYVLMSDLYLSGPRSSRSSDVLELVREEYEDEFSPAMLALLDDVLGRTAGNE